MSHQELISNKLWETRVIKLYKMTDSESDISNPNVFTFQNENTTVSARGPNTNITNFSFRNNQVTSSIYMPRNFERSRYAESVSDQRSIYYRRETSPMSIHSACDIRPRNFQQYYNGMGSHQSVYNGRSGSPVSMRSIDSSASVSAADIAFAFKNVKFNKYDLRVIKEAYHKLMKQRFRKRVEKRRNMKLFLKGSRRRSGDDSGEQGSDSSISSDDCRSMKTSYKENMPCTGSARMNLTDFRKTVRDNNMIKHYSENLKQNGFKNMFSVNTSSRIQNLSNTSITKHNNPVPTLKDRFKNGFVLPSQRFNRSVASSVIPESTENQHKNMDTIHRQNNSNCISNNVHRNRNGESGSEEEIFSGTIRENYTCKTQQELSSKRSLDSDDDSSLPNKKKSKISSPVNTNTNKKLSSKTKDNDTINNNDRNSNNFEFAKPMLPVRKSKSRVQEKVIAKSKQPLTGFVEHMPNNIGANIDNVPHVNISEKISENQLQEETIESTENGDISMRPSFIKRKLFTQKLDVAEKANISSDSTNSPQSNVYSALQKEKNKARKLVTNQSCLNRDVQEENNLLDLIHKIVPPDRINITNQTTINHNKTDAKNLDKKDDDDKWDVTSVISMCNEQDVSDTFTDEEIFNNDTKDKDAKKKKDQNTNPISISNASTKINQSVERNLILPRECRIIVENVNYNQPAHKRVLNRGTNIANTNINKLAVKSSAKTFWDTDFESDAESQLLTQKSYIKENVTQSNIEASTQEFKKPVGPSCSPVSKQYPQGLETSRWLNNTKTNITMNNTLDSMRKFNISTLSVRSHRTTKKKKCSNEVCFQEITSAKTVGRGKRILPPETKNANGKLEITSKNASKTEIKGKSTLSKFENKNNTTKPESKNKKTSQTNSTKTIEMNKKTVSKSNNKTESRTKTPIKNTKSKPDTVNIDKSRSTSRTRQKSKENKPKPRKQTDRKINISNQVSPKERPVRSCRTPSQNRSVENSRSSHQFDITPLNIVANQTRKDVHKFIDTSLEVTPKLQNNRKNITSKIRQGAVEEIKINRTIKSDLQSKISTKKAKQNHDISVSSCVHKSPLKTKSKPSKQVKQVTKNIPNHPTPKCDRPIRSCRTPSQNRSIENYKSSIRGR